MLTVGIAEVEDAKPLQAQAHTVTHNSLGLQSNGANHAGSSALQRHPQVEREVERGVKVEEGVAGVDARGGRTVGVEVGNASHGGIVVKKEPGHEYRTEPGFRRRRSVDFDSRMRVPQSGPKREPDEPQRQSLLFKNAVGVKSEEDRPHEDQQRSQFPGLSSGFSSAVAGSVPVRVKEETRDEIHTVKREDPESNAASGM